MSSYTCPHCQQGITLSPTSAGQTVTCPHCQRPVAVPAVQEPVAPLPPPIYASAGTSAQTQPPTIPRGRPTAPLPGKSSKLPIILILAGVGLVLLLVALGIAGLFVFRQVAQKHAGHRSHGIRVAPPGSLPIPHEDLNSGAPANDWQGRADPNVEIPDEPLKGTLGGIPFNPKTITLSRNVLTLREAFGTEIIIFTFANRPSLTGHTILVPNENSGMRVPTPHVHLRYKENDALKAEVLSRDYVMRLEFGTEQGGKIPVKLFLQSPSQFQTQLAGTFEADLK